MTKQKLSTKTAQKKPLTKNIVDYVDMCHINTPVSVRREKNIGNIYMNTAECGYCGWIIRSRNKHHTDTCKCGKSSIDGGSHYIKARGDNIKCHTILFTEQDEGFD